MPEVPAALHLVQRMEMAGGRPRLRGKAAAARDALRRLRSHPAVCLHTHTHSRKKR